MLFSEGISGPRALEGRASSTPEYGRGNATGLPWRLGAAAALAGRSGGVQRSNIPLARTATRELLRQGELIEIVDAGCNEGLRALLPMAWRREITWHDY